MDKRKGKRTIGERTAVVHSSLPKYSLEEAIAYVINVKKSENLKERTISGYVQNMRYFTEWLTERHPDMILTEITPQILREYVLWCANDKEYYGGHPFKADSEAGRKGLSASSVNVRIRVLKVFFNTMYAEGLVDHNPAQNLSLMRQDVDTVEPLSDDDLRRLLRTPDRKYFAQNRDYIGIMLILDTGIRLNELCALEVADIDFRKKVITLPAVKNKNRRSRMLPLSNEVVRLLKQLVDETTSHFNTTYVFTTNYGEPLDEKTFQKALSKYADKAKIVGRVTPHVLRHNFASMAAHNGMSVFHLMKILGHADIATTRKYVQVSEEDLFEQHREFSPIQRVLKRR
jgi:integrase/recombinase XerD